MYVQDFEFMLKSAEAPGFEDPWYQLQNGASLLYFHHIPLNVCDIFFVHVLMRACVRVYSCVSSQ